MKYKICLIILFMFLSACSKNTTFKSYSIGTEKEQYYKDWELDYLKINEYNRGDRIVKIGIVDSNLNEIPENIHEYRDFTNLNEQILNKTSSHGDLMVKTLNKMLINAEIYYGAVSNHKGEIDDVAVTNALKWLKEKKVDVINLSFSLPKYNSNVENLLKNIYYDDTIIVAASGNDGLPVVSYPASSIYTVAIGASDIVGNKATFSNYGKEIDFCTPGKNIFVDNEKYEGTSFSSIIFTGILANVLSNYSHIKKSPLQFLKEISSSDVKSIECGYGIPILKQEEIP